MKVLLIQPPVEDFFFTPRRSYPLGLLSLATVLKRSGFDVSIFNCQERRRKRNLAVPEDFVYLKRYYQSNRSPFCLFSQYQRFGEDDRTIEQELLRLKPQVVGISANFTAYLGSSLEIARMARRVLPGSTIVLGGRAASADPELFLRETSVDFVLRGEAEFAFLKLCRGLLKARLPRIKGLCRRDRLDKPRISVERPVIKDLDSLPVIDHSFIAAENFRFQGMLSASLLASRGCDLGCSFCAITGPLRCRKPQEVLREMEQCYCRGIRHFNFEDDNINYNPKFGQLLDMIIGRFGQTVRISFMNGLLTRGLDSRLRQRLVEAGLTHLDLSMVSSQQKFRKQLKRQEDPGRIFELADFMADKDIPATVHYISGFPGQSYEQAIKDIRLLAGQRLLLGASIFYPVSGSPLGGFSGEYQFYRSSCACYDRDISRDRIFSLFYFSRIVNFIKQLLEQEKIGRDFSRYVMEKTKPLQAADSSSGLVLNQRLDRMQLGVYLLHMMLKENRVFRVEEKHSAAAYRYEFKPETFVEPDDLREFLRGLTVRSISGRTVVLK